LKPLNETGSQYHDGHTYSNRKYRNANNKAREGLLSGFGNFSGYKVFEFQKFFVLGREFRHSWLIAG